MGSYGDDRYGGERAREPRRDWHRDRDYGREQGRGGYGGDRDERGFFDRAGDELRSWFGDDDAQRRREFDQRRWEQEQRMTGTRGNDSGPGSLGGGGFGSGWGNQAGESWNRDRPGARSFPDGERDEYRGGGDRHYASGEREGWFTDSRGGERGERYGGSGGGGASGGVGGQSGGHDPLYSEWRRRQIEDLDRDYDEWRREHQSRFEQEFGTWRSKRQSQRQALGQCTEHMEVVGSDGSHIGTVDKVSGERIILTRSDPSAGGIHHSVPCSWVETVEDKVTLNRTAEQARAEWRTEEQSRALFERGDDAGRGGPHALNRSFSGTYSDGDASRGGPRGDRNDL